MKSLPFPPARYVDSDTLLRELCQQLAAESLLALDSESNSLHAYQERVCLIQLSTRTTDYIIDPLAIQDVQPLGALLADSRIEKVFHAAEYDLICLKRDFGFGVTNLFDTMIAARICGLKEFGLGALLAERFGVKLDKRHQRDNWGRRPLPKESLRYAQMDTHYLPALRDHLHAEVARQNRLREAQEIFADACRVTAASESRFDPDGYWSLGIPADLNRRQMAVLRELYLLREGIARERDCPPFKVLGNKTLIDLAVAEPHSLNALKRVGGMSSGQIGRYGRRILDAVQRGQSSPLPPPPQHQRADPELAERYAQLHAWRKARAEQRGVEADVIISRNTLWQLAREMPATLEQLSAIQGLGPWRLEAYGAELLDLIGRLNGSG